MNIIGEFLGYLAGTCLAISFLPQAIKIIKNKDILPMNIGIEKECLNYIIPSF